MLSLKKHFNYRKTDCRFYSRSCSVYWYRKLGYFWTSGWYWFDKDFKVNLDIFEPDDRWYWFLIW